MIISLDAKYNSVHITRIPFRSLFSFSITLRDLFFVSISVIVFLATSFNVNINKLKSCFSRLGHLNLADQLRYRSCRSSFLNLLLLYSSLFRRVVHCLIHDPPISRDATNERFIHARSRAGRGGRGEGGRAASKPRSTLKLRHE